MEDVKRVLAIDLGSGKVAAIVAEVGLKGEIRVLGVGRAKSTGIRGGRIINIEKTAISVKEAAQQAYQMAKSEFDSVLVGITGSHIKGATSKGLIAISNPHLEITQEDVYRVINQAKTISIPMGREVLYVHPNSYTIDDQKGIKEPIGMIGMRLEVEAYIVTAQSTVIMNIKRALSKGGIEDPVLMFQPIAASAAVLKQQDMEQGVALVDIGKDTTDIAVWYEGDLVHTAIVPIGGQLITNDIAIGLKIPVEKAEELKVEHGVASVAIAEETDDDSIEVAGVPGHRVKVFSKKDIAYIIEARVMEIFEFVREKLEQSERFSRLVGGVVLVGGTANLPGIEYVAEEVLGLPVFVRKPQNVIGVTDLIMDPSYSVVVGLPRLAVIAETKGGLETRERKQSIMDFLKNVFQFLKENF